MALNVACLEHQISLLFDVIKSFYAYCLPGHKMQLGMRTLYSKIRHIIYCVPPDWVCQIESKKVTAKNILWQIKNEVRGMKRLITPPFMKLFMRDSTIRHISELFCEPWCRIFITFVLNILGNQLNTVYFFFIFQLRLEKWPVCLVGMQKFPVI